MTSHFTYITGGTGYLGRLLIPELLTRGHRVRALVRPGSEGKLPAGAEAIVGDPLDGLSFVASIEPADTFIQLVGTPHPSPAKAAEFRRVDLVSVRESANAAATAGVAHFIYVSVAQGAPVMKVYQEVRAAGEAMIRRAELPATLLRPWYVLGPGHRWPYALMPLYWLLERLPPTRAGARRLGLVTWRQMITALVAAVEEPPAATRIVEVPEIRGEAPLNGAGRPL